MTTAVAEKLHLPATAVEAVGARDAAALRVLCVSNMWPGPHDPDFGAFVQAMCRALQDEACTVEVAAIDRRGGGPVRSLVKYARLTVAAVRGAHHADVIYAHFLFPTGAIALLAGRLTRTPVVVTAHGRTSRTSAAGCCAAPPHRCCAAPPR